MQDNKLNLSGLERLTPRADSWDKVCARLDKVQTNTIPFPRLAAIPLAAALLLVGAGVTFFALNSEKSTPISMNNVTSAELSSWYDNLGESNSETDDYEILDNTTTISYLMKE